MFSNQVDDAQDVNQILLHVSHDTLPFCPTDQSAVRVFPKKVENEFTRSIIYNICKINSINIFHGSQNNHL